MLIKESIQLHILDSIKQKLKPNISLVDELAELLEISKDSAYRRIRDEKSLDIKEVQIHAKYYNLSLDSILNADTNVLSFHTQVIGDNGFCFKDFLISILERLRMISQMDDKVISYSARDLPIFHYFMFPELAAFKIYFWCKTYLNEQHLEDSRFDLENLPKVVEDLIPTSEQIWKSYASIPSEELWSIETINIPLKQILYYHEAGIFNDSSQALQLIEKYEELLSVVQKEAQLGRKFIDVGNESPTGEVFNLYYNEVSLGDNSILFKMGDKKISFLNASIKISMTTANESFCNEMELYHNNFKRKSTLLSNTSEKQRLKFFGRIKEIIADYKRLVQ